MNKLKKITAPKHHHPAMQGILIRDNCITATDNYKLIKTRLQDDKLKDLDVVIEAKEFKQGDKINPDKTITRKDGSIFTPELIDDDYPEFEHIFPKNLGKHKTAKVNRLYLIDLLSAIKAVEVDISILDSESPLVITTLDTDCLLMPISIPKK